MAKLKTSVNDFMDLMDEEESSSERAAFSPKPNSKSENNHEPKWSQSGAKPEPLHKPIMSQSGAKPEPKISENSVITTNHEPQPEPLHKPIMSQSGAKPEPNNEFYSLVGLQKNSLLFIFETCLKNGSKTSSPISSSNLAIGLESTVAAVRKATRRLEEKGFIIRSQFKDGRGGWTKYELPNNIYSELLTTKTRANHEPIMSQSGAKRTTQPEPQPEPSVPYSSSNDFDKKNTITTGADALTIPENLRRFGISTVNLQNLINSGKATQEVIERSLGALSFDVENGKTGNLANIFFGVLGTGREYISQKYSETLQIELDSELARIKDTEEIEKKLQETKLQMKFKEYLEQNPEFIESVKNRHKTFVNSPSVLEKVAFEEFKALT